MNDCRLSRRERVCFVCGDGIPEGAGLYHAGYGMLLHHGGPCDALVTAEERIYDRSPRGRWRPKGDVLRRVRAARLALALERAVIRADEVPVSAMTTMDGFWYRGYVFLPLEDTWRFDTTSEHVVTRQGALAVIRDARTHQYPLVPTTLDTLLRNWQQYGIWPTWRPVGTAMLQRWCDLHGVALHAVPEAVQL